MRILKFILKVIAVLFISSLILILLIVSIFYIRFYCEEREPWTRPIPKCINDTINRPDYVSPLASYLIHVGGEVVNDEPCFIYWAEYIGSLKVDNKVYPHIKEVLVYYNENDTGTFYLENMDLRTGKITLDDENTRVTPVRNGDGVWGMSLMNGSDTIPMLDVILFSSGKTAILTVLYDEEEDKYRYRGYEEYYSIVTENDTILLEYDSGYFIGYKPSENCKWEDIKQEYASIMEYPSGKIYFLEKDSYIEPVEPW